MAKHYRDEQMKDLLTRRDAHGTLVVWSHISNAFLRFKREGTQITGHHIRTAAG